MGLSLTIFLTACVDIVPSAVESATPGVITSPDHSQTTEEDARYLTPVPEATIAAFAQGTPIVTRLQAVIAARAYLATSRLHFSEDPMVIFIQEKEPALWQVVFEGDYQVIGPDAEHTITPPAFTHGCVLVEFKAKEEWNTWIRTVECSPWRED